MDGTPHAIAAKIVLGAVGGLKGAGGAVVSALDAAPSQLGVRGPHHIPSRVLDAFADSSATLVRGVERALNQPTEEFGVPPDLGDIAGGMGGIRGFRLPW